MGPGFSAPPAAAVLREAQLSCPRLCLLQRRNIRPIPSRMSVTMQGRNQSVQPSCPATPAFRERVPGLSSAGWGETHLLWTVAQVDP